MSKQLAIQARDALRLAEWVGYDDPDNGTLTFCPVCRNDKKYGHYEDCQLEASTAALTAHIDAPEPEPDPVAWFSNGDLELLKYGGHTISGAKTAWDDHALYLRPPAPSEPLSDVEIDDAYAKAAKAINYCTPSRYDLARAIGAAVRGEP